MDRDAEAKVAIINRLSALGVQPNNPVSLYQIGTALVPAGFSEDELYGALVRLQYDGIIQLMTGNRIQLR